MAVINRVFAIFVIYTALGLWLSVAALNAGSSLSIAASPTVFRSGSTAKATTPSKAPSMTATPSKTITTTLSVNMTLMPSHVTVTPSQNTTITPSPNRTVTPSQNTTVTPSPNMTVTPSHNITVTPNVTVTPSHNMSITPSHNITVMPHNGTVMPSSAHTVMPTSSAHPTTPPPAPTGNFTVKENQTVCLFAYMGATFDIMIGSNRSRIVLPVGANATGACDISTKEPYITLQWHTSKGSCNFTMHFVTVEGQDLKWTAANLTFSLISGVGATGPITFHSGMEPFTEKLSADVGHAYICTNSSTDFKLTSGNSTVNVSLSHIEFQPFEVHDGHLGERDYCHTPSPPPATTERPPHTPTSKHKESHVVAIAVGCSLAGLVVIVIIGYLIGRRRSRNQSAGYRKL